MFKNTERILKFDSLDGVDEERLNKLLTRYGFNMTHVLASCLESISLGQNVNGNAQCGQTDGHSLMDLICNKCVCNSRLHMII